jgi:hypothetical protein
MLEKLLFLGGVGFVAWVVMGWSLSQMWQDSLLTGRRLWLGPVINAAVPIAAIIVFWRLMGW